MKKIIAIIASSAAILCICGGGVYTYMNSNTFLINKYIKTCSESAPNSPDYCKCKAYLNSKYNKDIFKQLAYADEAIRDGLMSSFPQDKLDVYYKKLNKCFYYLSDDDYLTSFKHPLPKMQECTKEAFYKLPEYSRWYLKTHSKDESDDIQTKNSKYFSKLIYNCLSRYNSDEEYKNKIAFDYFLKNDSLPSDNFEKCINQLSREEMEAYNENDIKALIKVEDCIFSEYSVNEIISTTAKAKIMLMEENAKKKMNNYGKTIIRKEILKCMEDKINKLSEEELKEFKRNVPDSEIVDSCFNDN